MFKIVTSEQLRSLRAEYLIGCGVELIYMDDPYNTKLKPGCLGTVTHIDDVGTIFVSWDCGSSLGVVYGEDFCRKISG